MRRLALFVLLLLAASLRAQERPANAPATVILISIDGWRWDYDSKAPAPNLRSLISRGVRAENLIPVFPSKTFPNHYTIVTGLYPAHHGIVANTIRDPETGRTFAMTRVAEQRNPMWWGGEPLWVTVQRQGLVAATLFWPGSEAPIGGMLPRYWKPYDDNFPRAERVDQVLQWLDLPAERRPTFITLYFSDVDSAGHADGPGSPAVRDAISRVDGYLGRLLRGLERRGIADSVNLVVVSDHGMAATDAKRVIVLDDYIDLRDVDVVDLTPTVGLFPKPGKGDAVYRALAGAHPHLAVYRRDETPERWRYRGHPRIPAIVGVADEGWQVLRRATLVDILANRIRGDGGSHGYDPSLMSMRGLFVAAGPGFKHGAVVAPFENVHIYTALAQVLRVTPAPNDGDTNIARALLR
jgi:predicted AlkP superfamily pyrophosphatase or phosphodiesterase